MLSEAQRSPALKRAESSREGLVPCGTLPGAMPNFSTVPNPPPPESGTNGATTGYERELWRMADTLRG